VLLIADGAGAHQKDVCLQNGITLANLPPYCPELNPVERFFEELRKDLSNQVYENIAAAENHLCDILQLYFNNKKLSS
jgi:transposase